MPNVNSFTCPSCGASLSIEGNSTEIKCGFCGNTVIVPPELRPRTPNQIVFQQIDTGQRAGRGMMGCILAIVVASVIGSVVIGIIAVIVPLFAVNSVMSSVSNITNNIPFAQVSTSVPIQPRQVEVTRIPKPSPTPGFANLVLTFGQKGKGPGYFDDARGIAADGDGNIYVSEYTSGRVQKFDAQGKFLSTWNTEGKNPLTGLAADRAGNVYVARQGIILKYNSGGELQTRFKGSGNDYIEDLAVLPDSGFVAFSFSNSDDVLKLNAQGNIVSRIKGAISSQTDNSELDMRLAVDGGGNIYALGTFNNGVFKFTRDGKYVSKFGEQGHDPGQFSAVQAIAVDNQSRVYVSDTQGIQVFSSEGRYLGVIAVPNHVAFGMIFNAKNELLVVSRDVVYKFVVNE